MERGLIFLFWMICISLHIINVSGCQLQGVNPVLVRVTVNILDVDRDVIYENQIVDITGVIGVVQNPGLNSGPYITGYISGTTFYLETTNNFAQYEENETEASIILNAQFRCLDGTSITQVFQVNIQDTNNNSPEFLPSNEYNIAIATPLLPGYQITGCQHNIIVKDIDLTTSRIDFALTGSDLFEIEYDEESSTTPKEFVAILRTSTFIRTLPEPVELTISATDVDATGDSPRTSYATVRITADSDAVLPEEPVFSLPLYTATYTDDNTIILDETISLQQGYHENVSFSLNEEYSSYFAIIRNGNNVSLSVTAPLSADILTRQQLYLIIRADREFTSGASATIVVQLPEEIGLEFERANYKGVIEDNTLTLPDLVLTQGYEGATVSVSVSNDFFSATIEGNNITLSMQPLTQEIIDENTFLNLEVTAQTERSSATTVVTLEIVKDDTVTPVFQSPIYIGSYETDIGLTLEQIELTQGFDNTVEITLGGDHSTYFQLIRNGSISTLTVESLPLEELGEQTIILTIHARKARTVGATASIYISLPEEIRLAFQQNSYEGSIIDNTLQVPNLILTQGYENLAVTATVSNEYFTASIQGNVITLAMRQLSDTMIQENSFLNLEVTATTSRSSASTVVTLEIIKNDTVTPLFENTLYSGTYTVQDGLILGQINVVQGYDGTVDVTLDGEHSNLFQLVRNGPSSTLTGTVPPSLFNQRNIALTVTATKPRTVGSTAVINIALPTDRLLEFGATTYKGTYENNILTLGVITLSTGYDETVDFQLSDYNQYFQVINVLNQVSIQQLQPLPDSIILENNFLALTLTASGLNALSASASVLIEIIKDDISTPVFSQNIYSGAYADGSLVIQDINLIQGFDSTVSFRLDGENSEYFSFNPVGNAVTLSLSSAIPEEVIFNQKTLVFSVLAEKPLTVGANAAILITFPSELTDPAILRFSQNTYIGSLQDGNLTVESIVLNTGYTQSTQFYLTGDYSSYFTLSNTNEVISITSLNTLPQEVIEEKSFIVLEVEARRDRAVSVFSSLIIELKHDEKIAEIPVFNAAYYRGSYGLAEGLQFTEQVYLVQGYDNTVSFELQGEHSELFWLSDNNNVVTLSARAIPENVWKSNDQLIFSLIANKPGLQNGQAAVVIDMPKDNETTILGFERTYYVGSLANETLNLDAITLAEGYSDDVNFTLHGELINYFSLTKNEATVRLSLQYAIPEESLPLNGIIVLEIQASKTDSQPAFTTIILEVVGVTTPDIHNLQFERTYYVGTYNTTESLSFEYTISLAEGYDDSVQFTLDGDDSIYFTIIQTGNSASLAVQSAIPPSVIANNNQLVFVVSAQSSGGASARATIVISLLNEIFDGVILGFERANYLGSINNESITLDPITLLEGYTDAVVFALHGDLQSYFTLARNGATLNLQLSNSIPEDLIPSNGIIILEVQASTTTDALPAITTIILEVIKQTTPEVENLGFSQTFYIGRYTTTEGLSLESTITLAEGYNDDIQFTLSGNDATYFGISQSGNSVSLTLSTAIPPAVIANNNHLTFVINAQSASGATAQATIVIALPNEISDSVVLGFERTNYLGSINNESITLDPITLSEGYTDAVVFALLGDLQSYFTLARNGATLNLQLSNSIPEDLIPSNGIIILEVQASTTTDALPAITTIILEVIKQTTPEVENLGFSQTFYIGRYTTTEGLSLESTITLAEGYNDDIQFTLSGNDATYFGISQSGNSVSLTLSTAIPPAVIANNIHLTFVINAQSASGATAQATIVIALPNEISDSVVLGFERTNYLGSINNESITLDPITLSEGYTDAVVFALLGDLQSYFTLARNGATLNLQLSNSIPEDLIPSNGIIILEVQASTTTDALPAITTIILEVIKQTTPEVENLGFSQTFYIGRYTTTEGLSLESTITLAEGYNDDIQFTLSGNDATYFGISQSGNSVSLTLSTAIPPAVIANNNHLTFVINAQSASGATAQATIVIALPNEISDSVVLGFERNNYLGSINNDSITLDPITLSEGYTDAVVFALLGDLQSYFTLARNGATLNLQLSNSIPEDLIPSNGIIILEVQASTTTDALPAITTIILEVIKQTTPEVENLGFSQTFYIGRYTTTEGLSLESTITLAEGYNDDIQFTLSGNDATYFGISQSGNSVSLTLSTAIPPAVIANNNHLTFVINAQSASGATAQATIVIALPNEISDSVVLGFERTNYLGSINNESITLDPITLSEGYTDAVVFALLGDLQSYFTLARNGATLNLQLSNSIPEDLIPSNGIIILEVQASTTTDALPAITTIILEVIKQTTPEVENLGFSQTFYIGRYTTTEGLSLESTITLAEGYNDDIQFTLSGNDATYFGISQSGNSVSLTLNTAIPPAVIANNNHLTFVINAQSASGATAQATIVIALPNEISDSVVLGFERTNYLGSINNESITLDPITLSEGYTDAVVFALLGDLQSYFTLARNGATLNLQLSNSIPEDLIPSNGIIILEVQASTTTDALPAITTIILEVIKQTTPEVENLGFSQTFYIGRYTTTEGLSLESTITLAEGYNDDIQFTLSGNDATYFGISQSGNSVSLTLNTAIPPAVIANNNHLTFVINAQSASGATAQATIVIALPNEISDSVVLGFERTNYLGSINNESITLDPITLSEGYTDAVVFALLGDLQSYFTLARNGATLNLQLSNSIPEDLIPSNGIIILEVQASTTTDALPAITTIILEVIKQTTPEVENLGFSQTFYIGRYTTTEGLSLESTITLAEGYNDDIQFTLSGNDATYFGISQSGNSVSLTLNTAIPPAVIANNNHLTFVINAQSASGATAQATIVIALPNEISDSVVLGFERTNYLGSINNESITLDPITLSEGYTDAVVFALLGDLQSYFTLARNGATLKLQLSNSIPEDLIPSNGIIILEVQASTTTDALPAITTIILEVIKQTTPEVENLGFSQTFYIGRYTTTEGLSLESTITLAEGYNDDIQFTLSGNDATYFGISQSGNSVSLTLSTAIPPAVIANNNHLTFVINAQSASGATAQATIVIALPNEISDSVVLGFERTNYLGSINNESITLDPITLSEGYTDAVVFALLGDLQSYFTLARNGATLNLQLSNSIPEDLIPSNGIIILEVQASTTTDALPAITTIILEVIKQTTPEVENLGFSQTFYIGRYTTTEGLSLESTITLAEGYNDDIQFTLSGNDATYFGISQSGNSVSLTLNTAIPPAVIANNNHLTFVINAQSASGATAQATIVIALPNEISDSVVLGFERTNYLGSINNESITLDPITLSEGYTDAVVFALLGDLQSYFTLARNGATLNLQLSNSIPEDLIPSNGIIILEVQASTTTDALPAITTIILEVIKQTTPEVENLGFSQTFYIGRYTTTEGLSLESTITLAEGYNDDIQFTLSGNDATYFGISQSGNSVSLTLSTAIPPAVIANNNHLTFVINAQSASGATAQATIVIALPNEISDSVVLGFERTNYLGSINNESITLDPITLSEGYTDAVDFALLGDLQSYFTLARNGATLNLQLSNSIPEDLIPSNGIIILEVQASTTTDALPAITTVILEVIKQTTPEVENLGFSQTFYIGRYTNTEGLSLESTITLAEGYNDDIQFTLSGNDATYFGISQSGNSVSLTLSTAIPPAVIANNNHLTFVINAQSASGATAQATIVIALPNEISDSVVLRFERTNYLGSINNKSITLDPITLSEGYTDAVVFALLGDLQSYFTLARNGATLNLQLSNSIPEDLIPSNGIIILEVQASTTTDALPAITTIILEVIKQTTPEVENLGFSQIFYIGRYTTTEGLSLESTITLAEGYNDDIQFTLSGNDATYFGISQSGNSVSLTLSTAIPPAVIANNNHLTFVINAQSASGATAQATIVIALPNEISDSVVLGFERTNYLGSINNESITLDPITLSEGYTDAVVFALLGDLQSYFTLARNGATLNLQLSNSIPEDLIPSNGIIILEVQASTTTDALPAITTIILEVIKQTTPEVENLGFSQTFYIGRYTTTEGLSLESTITLAEGYNDDIQFTLSGNDATYFGISQSGNSVSLTLSTAIPPAVIANNNHLTFVINAQSASGATAQATIVIALPNEISDSVVLGFERTNYLGSINNESITLDPITLSEGYTDAVVFALLGDLQSYFTLACNGATLNLQLSNSIPEDLIPSNGIIILEVQASTTTDALPAITTIILEVIKQTTPEVENLGFSQTFYIGRYTTTEGLSLESTITLAEGYNDDIQFTLSGNDATYFGISQSGNSVSLTLSTAIPPAVIANNNHLTFVINAQSASGATAQATIVIALPNEISDSVVLGFERTNYLGSINNESITLDPITLSEGYTDAVVFALLGDLQSYFTLARNGATLNLQLSNSIPEDLIPSNGIIILEVQASTTTDALPAITTIILEVIKQTTPEVENLGFSQTFYIGRYTTTEGLSLESTITLAEGYNDDIQFTLSGNDATYFEILQSGNAVLLTLSTAIPPAVIANNNHLTFVINAQSASGATAQATIVIALPNEISDSIVLGFERTNYLGSINNESITLDPITLSEGYTDAVVFALLGDLQSYFTLARNGATLNLQLSNNIPEDLIPSNGIIILEVQASTTTDALPAITTIILEVIKQTTPDVEGLTFTQTFYVGTYTAVNGLSLEDTISLAEGYNNNVQFALEGDDSTYFLISQSGNSLSLSLGTAIPPAVIANNNQLIFVINAQSSGAFARATIIINLPDEIAETNVLGFERSSYLGSITSGIVDIEPITLTEGYAAEVIFSLYGELKSYFRLLRNGATVIVQLQTTIPVDLVPTNGIIILEVQASTTDTLPAVTTIVLEVERSGGGPTVTFSKVLYEGLLQADTVEHETITVTGYDETTTIAIRGVYSEMFTASLYGGVVTVQRTGSVTLPTEVGHVAVEIHIGDAAAVLLLQVQQTDAPNPQPNVTFSPSNYVVRAEVLQTGLIGRVSASADNGETLVYSVAVEDAHLAARISVNNDGEIMLSSPANSGEYTFQVIATTRITQATGTATVHLTVDETSIVLPPLIVLDRDEEEAHENLVVFNHSEYSDCTYSLTNRFPANQDWLYVNETGLHAKVIDREDPSIAFMALSQVKVELEVYCNSLTRNKRSPQESRLDWLGPYDYGTSNWILGESIEHNPAKSIVNLIVNDINDNAPIFVGKENEPIAVGYPVPDLEDVVLPRALVELQATDADVGENAAILYWSAEPELAVSPTSGSVHIRDDVTLEQDQALVVHATDRNGQGLSASINLVVKLLDVSNIAVVIIRDAFIEDEASIIANLSSSVGYEVKALRAVVISDETDSIEENIRSRKKRQTRGSGASLELYVYGLVQREPVAVEILTEDLNNDAIGAISIASTTSLRDHLEARQISSGRDVGLLVATIVLSILLFILIVAILVWFFLKWRKERNYDEFSDENSLESRNESIGQAPKVDTRPKPRIDIDELKRSERRLQEMIDAPYNEVVTPTTSTKTPVESIIDISKPDPNIQIPIVINDKLKDADEDPSDVDEFGEIRPPRRKSVVTFNENVERIIHVDDSVEGSSTGSDIEVFRF